MLEMVPVAVPRPIELGLLTFPVVLGVIGLLSLQLVMGSQPAGTALQLVLLFGLCLLVVHYALSGRLRRADQELLPIVGTLTVIGLVAVDRLEPSLAPRQLLWVAVGSVAAIVTALGVPRIEWLARYR